MTTPRRAYIKRNRPAQTGELVGVRLQPEQIARIDAWRAGQPRPMTRPEAMRALIDQSLDGLTRSQSMFDLSEIIFTDRVTASPAPQAAPAAPAGEPANTMEAWPEDLQDSFILAPDPAEISRPREIKPVRKPLPEKQLDLLGPLGPLLPGGKGR